MARMISPEKYDFDPDKLGYKVGQTWQCFSQEGGVFSFDLKMYDYSTKEYTEPQEEFFQVDRKKIPARIINLEFHEVFEDCDFDDEEVEERELTDHDNQILESFSQGIKEIFSFPLDVEKITVLFVEINSYDLKLLPPIGHAIELIDVNRQSIAPFLVGTLISAVPGAVICLLAVSPQQDKIPVFSK